MDNITRRHFLSCTGVAAVSCGVGGTLSGCSEDDVVAMFEHGVASGDPLHDRVILWTRVTPVDPASERVRVFWKISEDRDFKRIITAGSLVTDRFRDYTVKIDAIELEANTKYFYRFYTKNDQSGIGITKTLPRADVAQVKLMALSCAVFSAGYFHVYAEASKQRDIDAALHLGDYIYELGRGGYASEDAQALGRLVLPENELITVGDYRTRYAQCRQDPDLQAFHAALPVIAVWDDHEIANNAWILGADNHNEEDEGAYLDRVAAALTAYSEWMPIRPMVDDGKSSLYRSFQFGNLLTLIMLDTRRAGRDKPLQIQSYSRQDGTFDVDTYEEEVNAPHRSMLGADQLQWLKSQLQSESKWHVLGQQVLMSKMVLPGAIATLQTSIAGFAELAAIAEAARVDPDGLTCEQRLLLAEKSHLLHLPRLPYNLDAWDGYPSERNAIFDCALSNAKNFVVLAGDTHNAWASNLMVDDRIAGVEFATPSVTSPGIEAHFGLDTAEKIQKTEAGVIQLIKEVQYANLADRGFLMLTFSSSNVIADWSFVSSIKAKNYTVLNDRKKRVVVAANELAIA